MDSGDEEFVLEVDRRLLGKYIYIICINLFCFVSCSRVVDEGWHSRMTPMAIGLKSD